MAERTVPAPAGPRIFVCHLVHSAPRQRGPGWYWWIEGADDFMTGPFNSEAECHSDVYRRSREANDE